MNTETPAVKRPVAPKTTTREVVWGSWTPDEPITYPVRFGDGRVVRADDL